MKVSKELLHAKLMSEYAQVDVNVGGQIRKRILDRIHNIYENATTSVDLEEVFEVSHLMKVLGR